MISNPETAEIHEVNEAFCEFTGLSREQLLGPPTTDHRGWYESADRAKLVEELQRSGRVDRMPIEMLRNDGALRRVGQIGGDQDDTFRALSRDQSRTRGVAGDLFGYAAQKQVLVLGAPMVTDYDQIGLPLFRSVNEFGISRSLFDEHGQWDRLPRV